MFNTSLKKLGLKEVTLAQDIGVEPKTISRYLNGMSAPKIETLFLLAGRFGCSAEDLWSYDFTNPKPDHPRYSARRPVVDDREFSYFEGMKMLVYYLKEETVGDAYE